MTILEGAGLLLPMGATDQIDYLLKQIIHAFAETDVEEKVLMMNGT